MREIAYDLIIRVPADHLLRHIAASMDDPALTQAYHKLRGTTSPSRIIEQSKTTLVIYEPSFDPVVRGHGLFKTGWTVSYVMRPRSPEETLVRLCIRYSRTTALLGLGLLKPQADNEIVHRIASLLAFERGYRTRTSPQIEEPASHHGPARQIGGSSPQHATARLHHAPQHTVTAARIHS